MKRFAALTLLGFLCACGSNSGSYSQSASAPSAAPKGTAAPGVVLHPSSMTFREAIASCKGALGSITFAAGHVRAQAAPGVHLNEPPASTGVTEKITFSDKKTGKSATVMANGRTGSVQGEYVTAKRASTVACVNAG